MTLAELIDKLQDVEKEYGASMPVVTYEDKLETVEIIAVDIIHDGNEEKVCIW